MELAKATQAVDLIEERKIVDYKIDVLTNKVKEFTVISFSGENGQENRFSMSFSHETDNDLVQAMREKAIEVLGARKDEIEAAIQAL